MSFRQTQQTNIFILPCSRFALKHSGTFLIIRSWWLFYIENICLQYSARLFKQTIDYFFKTKHSPPPQANSQQRPLPQTACAGPVCIQSIQKQRKRDTDAQYKTLLALPSWKLISHTSLWVLYVLLRSVNISEHFPCTVSTVAAVWTSILGIFLKHRICHYTHIDHKRCNFGCQLSINKTLYLKNRIPFPLYLHFCINVILAVSTCTRQSRT